MRAEGWTEEHHRSKPPHRNQLTISLDSFTRFFGRGLSASAPEHRKPPLQVLELFVFCSIYDVPSVHTFLIYPTMIQPSLGSVSPLYRLYRTWSGPLRSSANWIRSKNGSNDNQFLAYDNVPLEASVRFDEGLRVTHDSPAQVLAMQLNPLRLISGLAPMSFLWGRLVLHGVRCCHCPRQNHKGGRLARVPPVASLIIDGMLKSFSLLLLRLDAEWWLNESMGATQVANCTNSRSIHPERWGRVSGSSSMRHSC